MAMLQSVARTSVSRRLLTHTGKSLCAQYSSKAGGGHSTGNTAASNKPFSFLPSNTLPPKPRQKCLTEIRGPYYAAVTATYLDELLSDWGEFVDGVKFAGGAFSL